MKDTYSRPYFPLTFQPGERVYQFEKPIGALAAASHGEVHGYSINGASTFKDKRFKDGRLHEATLALHAPEIGVKELVLVPDSDAGLEQNESGNADVSGWVAQNVALHQSQTPHVSVGVAPLKPYEGEKQGAEDIIGRLGYVRTKAYFLDNPVWQSSRGFSLSPANATLGADFFTVAPPKPVFIVEGLIPQQVGVVNATGGVGKTTLLIWLALNLAAGRSVLGHRVLRQGPIIFFSAEDDRTTFHDRIFEVAATMALTPEEQQLVLARIKVEDLSGYPSRLVEQDRKGNLVQTPFLAHLIALYKAEEPILMIFDPLIEFGPGEHTVNDGMAAIVQAARRILREVNCAVLFVHHVNMNTAKDNTVTQHAGRGGTALGDGVRFEWQLVADVDRRDLPASIPQELASNDLVKIHALHVHKLNAAPKPINPYYIVRQGYRYTFCPSMPGETRADRAEHRRAGHAQAFARYIGRQIKLGVDLSQLTKTKLRDDVDARTVLDMSKKEIEAAIDRALKQGLLVEKDLPKGLAHGGRQKYVAPGESGRVAL